MVLHRLKNRLIALRQKRKVGMPLPDEEFLFFAPQLNVFFCKTPKVACTKISMMILEYLLTGFQKDNENPSLQRLLAEMEKKNGIVHEYKTACVPPVHAWPSEYIHNAMRSEELFKFSFVRNPYSRLVSAYEGKIAVTKAGAQNNLYRDVIWNSQMKAGKAPSFSFYNYEPPTFKEFVRYIFTTDTVTMNSHWRPQHLILRPDVVKYDFIGKFESFSKDMEFVLDELQRRNQIEFSNDVYHKIGVKTDNKNVYRADSWADYYDDETKALVYQKYKEDFDFFDYDPNL